MQDLAPALVWLRSVIACGRDLGGGPPEPRSDVAASLAQAAGDTAPGADWPADLVARPCPDPSPLWHLASLQRVLDEGARDRVAIARAAYHACSLAHALCPQDPSTLPRFSLIVPVYDRARLAAECVASALAQTHPAVEVIVVDDGSRDELEEALRPFGDRIQLLRQPNRGVSAARNRGIRAASGEILHFLDSDNLLDPDACERWAEAFRSVPDAELCFGNPRLDGDASLVGRLSRRPLPDGGPACPTADFLRVAARRFPFNVSGTALPRWVALEVGGFDERLATGEDARFWFQVALRGTKVAGLRAPINTRRVLSSGMTARWTDVEHPERGAVTLLDLIDLLRTPRAWRYVESCIQRMARVGRYAVIDRFEHPLLDELRAAVLQEVAELGRGERREGLSPRPMLLACRHATLRLERRGLATAAGGRFHRRFLEAIDAALATAAEPDLRDLQYWLPEASLDRNRAALRSVRAAADRAARRGRGLRRLANEIRRLPARVLHRVGRGRGGPPASP